jgi:hypothetical protein
MQVLGELYLHSFPELRRVRGTDLLRIEVVAEKPGSYETVLTFFFGAVAGGIIGNRADAAVVWSFRELVKWYKRVIRGFVRTKSTTTDVTAIAAALEQMAAEAEIPLEYADQSEDAPPLFELPDTPQNQLDDEPVQRPPTVSKSRVLAELIDQALHRATEPLAQSCERVKLFSDEPIALVEIGPAERAIIIQPLSLPPPKREWRAARVKFDRIHRKTGRALFKFEHEADGDGAAHYSRIIDPEVRKPHNVYSKAFYDNVALDVWIRQVSPQKGNLNFQWEIQASNPDQGTLFNMPPEDGPTTG